MPNYQQLRADRAIVEQAARRVRDQAIADGYLGLEGKHFAFGLALILDEQLRQRVVDLCRQVLASSSCE